MQKIIKIILILCFTLQNSICIAQSSNMDSLLSILDKQEGKPRMETLRQISVEYMNKSVEEAIKYASELLMIAE